jgi:hypothetical protein
VGGKSAFGRRESFSRQSETCQTVSKNYLRRVSFGKKPTRATGSRPDRASVAGAVDGGEGAPEGSVGQESGGEPRVRARFRRTI